MGAAQGLFRRAQLMIAPDEDRALALHDTVGHARALA
jgi:hypothetical protein